jgi:hypothetical protein
MTRRFVLAAALAALMVPPAAFAHDDYRIIGTVEKLTATHLDVKQTKDGKVISMRLQQKSIVTRNKKKVPIAEVKPGVHVVVDARGDNLTDLFVVEIRLVPPPAPPAKK